MSREIWNLRAIEEYCTETGGEISNFEKPVLIFCDYIQKRVD